MKDTHQKPNPSMKDLVQSRTSMIGDNGRIVILGSKAFRIYIDLIGSPFDFYQKLLCMGHKIFDFFTLCLKKTDVLDLVTKNQLTHDLHQPITAQLCVLGW